MIPETRFSPTTAAAIALYAVTSFGLYYGMVQHNTSLARDAPRLGSEMDRPLAGPSAR
jgi:hypothetical protein